MKTVLMVLLSLMLLAFSCPPETGFYCEGPAGLNVYERDPTTGELVPLLEEGNCRPGRWSLRGDDLVALADSRPFRPAVYTPFPTAYLVTDVVVRATRSGDRWDGELTLPTVTLDPAGGRLLITNVSIDHPESPTRLVVSAATDAMTVTLTIDAPPASDHDALLAEATQRLADSAALQVGLGNRDTR